MTTPAERQRKCRQRRFADSDYDREKAREAERERIRKIRSEPISDERREAEREKVESGRIFTGGKKAFNKEGTARNLERNEKI